jgi:hypothetical protein
MKKFTLPASCPTKSILSNGFLESRCTSNHMPSCQPQPPSLTSLFLVMENPSPPLHIWRQHLVAKKKRNQISKIPLIIQPIPAPLQARALHSHKILCIHKLNRGNNNGACCHARGVKIWKNVKKKKNVNTLLFFTLTP